MSGATIIVRVTSIDSQSTVTFMDRKPEPGSRGTTFKTLSIILSDKNSVAQISDHSSNLGYSGVR